MYWGKAPTMKEKFLWNAFLLFPCCSCSSCTMKGCNQLCKGLPLLYALIRDISKVHLKVQSLIQTNQHKVRTSSSLPGKHIEFLYGGWLQTRCINVRQRKLFNLDFRKACHSDLRYLSMKPMVNYSTGFRGKTWPKGKMCNMVAQLLELQWIRYSPDFRCCHRL